ncbi:MAG: hypothetical protein MK098_12555 [Marinovum sp.]|nr:hypothetical protein [Marinovum sp.]
MINLRNGALELVVHPMGARLSALRFHGRDMILTCPDDIDPHTDWGYLGAVMGPVTNRITLKPDLVGWQGPDTGIVLHGNPHGLHAKLWELTSRSPTHAEMTISLPAGSDGFSANRHITARYELADGDTVSVILKATTDAQTLMNLTVHPYFALGPTPGLNGHKLQVSAPHILPIDDKTCPTGEILEVKGTEYDFQNERSLTVGAPDLDHNFCLVGKVGKFRHAATLIGPDNWSVRVATSQPGVQVYDGRTTDSYGLGKYAGIALEPQLWPNAPIHRNFPSIELAPDQTFLAQSTFTFAKPD